MKRVCGGETIRTPLNLTLLMLLACAGCSGTRPWLRGSKDQTPPPPQLAASDEPPSGEQQPPNFASATADFDSTDEQLPPSTQASLIAKRAAAAYVQPNNDARRSPSDATWPPESLSTSLPQMSQMSPAEERHTRGTTVPDTSPVGTLSGLYDSHAQAGGQPPPSAVAPASSDREIATSVQLKVTGVRPNMGPVRLAVFTDSRSFPNPESAAWTTATQATEATLAVTYPNQGRLAVAAYQDLNNDGELNRNRFGIPLEPFAFSNNALGKRGPPTFEQAAVEARPRSSVLLTLP